MPKARQKLVTDVFGMADVDLVVSERQRVIDVGGTTTFQIRLRNYGTKDATNILLIGHHLQEPQAREQLRRALRFRVLGGKDGDGHAAGCRRATGSSGSARAKI